MSTIDTAAAAPDPRLRVLDALVGRWTITGEAQGESTYEWMDGGFFLLQRGSLTHGGRTHDFLEVIGFEHGFEATGPAEEITSRVYTTTGDTLDYVYEADKETLTIWGGAKGSPAAYRGRWEEAGEALRGAWHWPGGGYATVMRRVQLNIVAADCLRSSAHGGAGPLPPHPSAPMSQLD